VCDDPPILLSALGGRALEAEGRYFTVNARA
jgi:hypothetical protein